MASNSKLIKIIRDHQQYKKFRKIVLVARERIHVEQDKAEALSLHAGRNSRKLYGNKQYSPKALIEAASQDMAYRSRLVELRVQCSVNASILDEAIDAISSFIRTEFTDELTSYKTVADKSAFIERVVSGAIDIRAEADSLIELLDTLVKDIDSSSFRLTQMVECLKLLDNSKGGSVV